MRKLLLAGAVAVATTMGAALPAGAVADPPTDACEHGTTTAHESIPHSDAPGTHVAHMTVPHCSRSPAGPGG